MKCFLTTAAVLGLLASPATVQEKIVVEFGYH